MSDGRRMSSNLIEDEFPNQLSSVDNRLAHEQRHRHNLWRSNYHEASIYIEEGLNNDKFENHPRKRATLVAARLQPSAAANADGQDSNQTTPLVDCSQRHPLNKSTSSSTSSSTTGSSPSASAKNAYLLGGQYTTIETYILVHNRYFYQLDLAASLVLLLLAVFEPPAVAGYELNTTVHAAIEMFALGIIAIELLLKFRWMGPKRFFHHGRTVTKLVVLFAMNIEAIVIFLRHSSHARYSRALRPIFLIDNHYCHGMRRAVRQIFQSLPPILDMLTLALFFMFVFSIFGFYLFAANNTYFADMPATVGNLLILATTANLPDVMMPSYAATRWSTIYFVLFVIVHLFLMTNLTMAAVYESFTRKEKAKFHKLLLHRRKACQEAFKLLVSRRQPNRIQYRQFMGLMRYLNRKCSMFDAYLIFKALDTDKNGSISLSEFYQIYDFINLEWKLIHPCCSWYDHYDCMPAAIKATLAVIANTVTHKYFDRVIDLLIATAALLQFIEATTLDFSTPVQVAAGSSIVFRPDSISTAILICVFAIEALLKVLALGLSNYWTDRWNRFDLLVLAISLLGLSAGQFGLTPFGWVIVLRVLRLMRLFEFKRRYRDIWQTLTYILLKRFVSMTCLVMILYYFFAIIGMELLAQYDLRNCCKNTTLESQFKYDNSTESAGYYLNDFGDIIASYLTLFSMTSNTYWLATMSAYAIVSETDLVRIYFAFYYLCSIIVMNIVIAFILESFLFRIHYRSKMGDDCNDTNLFTVQVTLMPSEVEFLRKNLSSYPRDTNYELMLRVTSGGGAKCRRRTSQTADDETVALLSAGSRLPTKLNRADHHPTTISGLAPPQIHINDDNLLKAGARPDEGQPEDKGGARELEEAGAVWCLVYQAEQIRNKFSFTMKMYADEVEGWLAEAERADQAEMGEWMSQNQIRAEHVAMARLVRRSIADVADPHSMRVRSWSSSSGILGERQRRNAPDPTGQPKGSPADG